MNNNLPGNCTNLHTVRPFKDRRKKIILFSGILKYYFHFHGLITERPNPKKQIDYEWVLRKYRQGKLCL